MHWHREWVKNKLKCIFQFTFYLHLSFDLMLRVLIVAFKISLQTAIRFVLVGCVWFFISDKNFHHWLQLFLCVIFFCRQFGKICCWLQNDDDGDSDYNDDYNGDDDNRDDNGWQWRHGNVCCPVIHCTAIFYWYFQRLIANWSDFGKIFFLPKIIRIHTLIYMQTNSLSLCLFTSTKQESTKNHHHHRHHQRQQQQQQQL